MVVCDPKTLLAASRCLPCLTPVQRRAAAVSTLCKVAIVGLKGGGGGGPSIIFPTPNLAVTSNISGTVLTATWDIPPGGATGTEIWISPDGVTYHLDTTVAAAFNTHFYGAIAVGSFEWFKVRYTNGAGGFSNFSTPSQWSGQAMDWAARIQTNLGNANSSTDITNVNNLWCAIFNAGLSSQILVLNPLIGTGNIIEMVTPLIKGAGTDPWANHNFVNASCTINGLVGNASAGLFTNFIPTSFASDNNAGVSCYTTGANDGTNYTWGGYDGANGIMSLHANDAGSALFDCFNLANRSTVVSPALQGFYSVNRVAAADLRLYFANSTNAIAQVGATNVAAGSARSTINLCVGGLALNNAGSGTLFNTQTISFWAATNGLSLAQATTLFNAVQAYRVAVGGGFA